MSSIDNVTLGDEKVEISRFEKYKGRKGCTDRIAILSSTLFRGWTYFHEGKKKSFMAPKDPETLKLCRESMGEPQQRFSMVIFQYATTDDGEFLTDEKLKGKTKLWNITETRFQDLTSIHSSWPLLNGGADAKQHDLMIKCTEEKYQKMNFQPCPEAFWKSKESWYKALTEKCEKANDQARKIFGPDLPNEEILAILGVASTSSGMNTDASDEIDLSDVVGD